MLTYLRSAVVSKTERVVATQVYNVVSSTNGYDYDTAVSLFSYCRSRNGDKEKSSCDGKRRVENMVMRACQPCRLLKSPQRG